MLAHISGAFPLRAKNYIRVMRLWLSTCLDDFTSEFDDIEEMFKRGLTRLILQKRVPGSAQDVADGAVRYATDAQYERWLMALPMEYRDRIWVRGTPDMAERLEVRGCVCDAALLAQDVPERWKRVNCIAVCRNLEQINSLPEWVAGALVGPVFQPQSIYEPVETLGIACITDKLAAQDTACDQPEINIPPQVIAFGGIDHENLDDIKKLPLQGISVLGGIWNYADPVNAFIKLGRACGGL